MVLENFVLRSPPARMFPKVRKTDTDRLRHGERTGIQHEIPLYVNFVGTNFRFSTDFYDEP